MGGMGKVGKTFTLDMKVLLWIESAAKKAREKESAFVNSILIRAKRQDETWKCEVCGSTWDIGSISCNTLVDGEFCEGVKA